MGHRVSFAVPVFTVMLLSSSKLKSFFSTRKRGSTSVYPKHRQAGAVVV